MSAYTSDANGVEIRGLNQEADRISVKSNMVPTFALLGRKWKGLAARKHEVSILRDELLVLKCEGGHAHVEIKHLGGPHGELIADGPASPTLSLRTGQKMRFTLRNGESLVLKCRDHVYPYQRAGKVMLT